MLDSVARRCLPCSGAVPFRALTDRSAALLQAWDTVQAFASNLTGALATRAVLGGMGVGDAEATPLAATITWLLKVGTITLIALTCPSLRQIDVVTDDLTDWLMMDGLIDMTDCCR